MPHIRILHPVAFLVGWPELQRGNYQCNIALLQQRFALIYHRKKYTGHIALTGGASINLTWVAPGFQHWSIAYHSEVGFIGHVKRFFCGNKWFVEVSNQFINIWSVNTSHQLLHCFIYQKLVSFTYTFPWVFRPWT